MALCTRIIDGDTVELNIDLGFNIHHVIRGRLYNVNAPEIFSGTDKENGMKAKEHLQMLIEGCEVVVNTYKDRMSFNRWVVEIEYQDHNINESMSDFCKTLLP